MARDFIRFQFEVVKMTPDSIRFQNTLSSKNGSRLYSIHMQYPEDLNTMIL